MTAAWPVGARHAGARVAIDKGRVLESARLRLRPPVMADCETIVRWRNDPRVRTYFPQEERLTVAAQRRYLDAYLARDDDLYMVIETRQSRRAVGTIALYHLEPTQAELGRLLIGEQEFLGQGMMREAVERVLEHAFIDLRLERVYLETFRENEPAYRLYVAAGFAVDSEQRVPFPRGKAVYTRVVMSRRGHAAAGSVGRARRR